MTVRLLSQGKTSNYDDYLVTIKKWEDHVRESPGAVRVEGYGDRGSGTVYFDEEWADGDALMNHLGQMQESGLFDELMSLQSIDTMFLLTPTDHPGVNALLDQFGANRMERFATSQT
jgi:quinol monooxygenase YgiN